MLNFYETSFCSVYEPKLHFHGTGEICGAGVCMQSHRCPGPADTPGLHRCPCCKRGFATHCGHHGRGAGLERTEEEGNGRQCIFSVIKLIHIRLFLTWIKCKPKKARLCVEWSVLSVQQSFQPASHGLKPGFLSSVQSFNPFTASCGLKLRFFFFFSAMI